MATPSSILPGEPQGQRSMAGYSPWSCEESDTTERVTHTHITENNLKKIYICFPGGASSKEPACQCSRHKRSGFDPWVGKIPWRKAWQPTPVFLPGKSEEAGGLESTVTKLDQTEGTQHAHIYIFPFQPPNSILIRFPFIRFYTSHMEFSSFWQICFFFLKKNERE